MELLFQILLLITHSASSLIHVLGTYLLCTCTRQDKHNVQHLFFINLALTELTSSVIWIVNVSTPLLHLTTTYTTTVLHHASTTMVSFVLYLTLFYITLNALLDTTQALRYRIYWNNKRVKCVLVVTWVLGIVFLLCALAAHEITSMNLHLPLNVYLYTPLSAAFVLVAFFTCVAVYTNYARTVAELKYHRVNGNRLRNLFPPGFYVPVLVVVTFIVFVIAPNVSYLFFVWRPGGGMGGGVYRGVCAVLYGVCCILHGLFYIFLRKETKSRLWAAFTLGRIGRYQVPKRETKSIAKGDDESAIFWINKKDDASIILGGPEILV